LRDTSRSRWERPRGLALIELVVVIVIIALLAAAFYGLWGRKGGGGKKTIPGQAIDKAKGVECQNMLSQVRASIRMEMDSNMSDQPPPAIPSDMAPYAKCPVSGQPYTYDPRTGQVHCTTPGHEQY
jgi:prepilin-type N-terminal cleavage/methylation domain-containing protein